jgi:mRNA interferase RelE/StbE
MRYSVILIDEVRDKLREMPDGLRREIGYRLSLLEQDLGGNVKKLQGSANRYRLRIGNYRAIFELEGERITVYRIGLRKDIYR